MTKEKKEEKSYDELCAMFLEDWIGVPEYEQSDINMETKDMVKRMIDRGWIKE